MQDSVPGASIPARVVRGVDGVVLTALVLAAAYACWQTVGWRYRHDTAVMFFLVSLTDRHGLLPWRDWFDMNMPGTYLTYLGIAKVFGYEAGPIRLADALWTSAVTAAATLGVLRGARLGVRVAAGALFVLFYLRGGGAVTLQREMLALLPVALGVAAAVSTRPERQRALLAGLAFGAAVTYKPQLGLGLAPVLAYLLADARARGADLHRLLATAGWTALGAATPVAVALLGMLTLGVFDDFRAMLPYLEYHSLIGAGQKTFEGAARNEYLWRNLKRPNPDVWWLGAAALGVAASFRTASPEWRRRLLLQVGLIGAYWLTPAISGQFYAYHWLPFTFFVTLAFAWLFDAPARAPVWALLIGRLIAIPLLVRASDVHEGFAVFANPAEFRPAEGRVDAISAWLREHVEPGQTVQSFDWVGGGVLHAMLIADAVPATRFVYTFHFYHHVDEPYIQALRREFLDELEANRPDYVVESRFRWPYVSGPGTTKEFPEYEAWKAAHYELTASGDRYEIWARRP